ncbi:phosphotransferase enzyme family protein [Kribbella turkmenica]|uniref:phosphotransferase enzyme family protein n=1 Tax=Kribbella turkmenica TaxID=2530375 RepID=UPI001404EC85|nr:phosphotransferase [Kribbella turkmenica]
MIEASDLARDYGLTADELRPHAGGFNSDCWVADSKWFVKVWRRGTPEDLDLLCTLAATGLPVPAPLRTVAGELHAIAGGRPYAVFPYVHGRMATHDDWRPAAQALKRVHALEHVDLPPATLDEPAIWPLRDHLDHPWIADRREEVVASIARLEHTIERARTKTVRHVVCHLDLHGLNLILDDSDEIAAIVDWEQAVIGPREHDVWIAAEGAHLEAFLTEYGARDLDSDHLEYALLARGLRDLAARVFNEVDRPGVDTWGFRRIAKLDTDLARFRPFCR